MPQSEFNIKSKNSPPTWQPPPVQQPSSSRLLPSYRQPARLPPQEPPQILRVSISTIISLSLIDMLSWRAAVARCRGALSWRAVVTRCHDALSRSTTHCFSSQNLQTKAGGVTHWLRQSLQHDEESMGFTVICLIWRLIWCVPSKINRWQAFVLWCFCDLPALRMWLSMILKLCRSFGPAIITGCFWKHFKIENRLKIKGRHSFRNSNCSLQVLPGSANYNHSLCIRIYSLWERIPWSESNAIHGSFCSP